MSRIARWRRRTSASASSSAGRAGSIPARHRISSHNRLPSPATRDWSMMTAFTGARLLATIARSCASVRSNASGPSRSSSGSSSTAPEAARVAEEHRAAVGEGHAEAVPRGIRPVARVEQRITGGFVVDEHPPAHPEVQAEDRTRVDVDEDELAAPSGRRERRDRAARRARPGGEPALQKPCVGRVHPGDLTVECARVEQRPRRLDLENLRQDRSVVRHTRTAEGRGRGGAETLQHPAGDDRGVRVDSPVRGDGVLPHP